MTTGSTSSFIYDATEFVRHEASQGRRIIVVTGNYRVNIFGFLASQDLVETDPDGLAGNYGEFLPQGPDRMLNPLDRHLRRHQIPAMDARQRPELWRRSLKRHCL